MSDQPDRVDRLAARLTEGEAARRRAVQDGNHRLAKELAATSRALVDEAMPAVLRGLVLRWMVQRGEAGNDG